MKVVAAARVRARMGTVLVGAAVLLSACGTEAEFAADVERDLDAGRGLAAVLADAARGEVSAEEAIAAGYLERLRLGLGSPFRLIEYGLQDPRLERPDRERLAWALLARTLDGAAYRTDARSLGDRDPDRSLRHLRLIEGAVRGAADPDVGVLAVRLAYTMAEAEGTLSRADRDRAMVLGSLVRDRALSRRDARRLLAAAGDRIDPLSLLTVWRVERSFHVERPSALVPGPEVEREAVAIAPRLLESIRGIQLAPRNGPVIPSVARPQRPLLGAEAARVLAAEAAAYQTPPQTPVLVAVRRFARLTGDSADAATRRFFENAINEERLAAEFALLHADSVGLAPRLAVLAASVGLRAYAQERPWFPGFEGPARLDLEDRYGLAAVTFDDGVAAEWRPYYRRMLESALADLQRVLPSLDLRGLKVRFAERGTGGTLAVHDPATRTVFIPAGTGAGTIAHEIAHDIDWQTALRRYRVRGDYGTDRAVRLADDRLAAKLRGLTSASLSDQPEAASHAHRPAEVFARSVDWFVAVALARKGRLNGYLSSVQDDVLTGYGTVTPPDVTGTAGEALVALLDEVAPVHPETRTWFLGSYGRLRAPTAYDLARRVVEADLESGLESEARLARLSRAIEELAALAEVRDSVVGMVEGVCRPLSYDNGAVQARRRLVLLVTAARARGIAIDAAHDVAGREGAEWAAAALRGLARDPEPAPELTELLKGVVERARQVGEESPAPARLQTVTGSSGCGPLTLGAR